MLHQLIGRLCPMKLVCGWLQCVHGFQKFSTAFSHMGLSCDFVSENGTICGRQFNGQNPWNSFKTHLENIHSIPRSTQIRRKRSDALPEAERIARRRLSKSKWAKKERASGSGVVALLGKTNRLEQSLSSSTTQSSITNDDQAMNLTRFIQPCKSVGYKSSNFSNAHKRDIIPANGSSTVSEVIKTIAEGDERFQYFAMNSDPFLQQQRLAQQEEQEMALGVFRVSK